MPRPPKTSIKPEDLPVLTERTDVEAKIPVLTEKLGKGLLSPVSPTSALNDAEIRRLAAQLAPRLEAMLREKFASHFEALWQESWHEVEQNLPDLIRDQFASRGGRAK